MPTFFENTMKYMSIAVVLPMVLMLAVTPILLQVLTAFSFPPLPLILFLPFTASPLVTALIIGLVGSNLLLLAINGMHPNYYTRIATGRLAHILLKSPETLVEKVESVLDGLAKRVNIAPTALKQGVRVAVSVIWMGLLFAGAFATGVLPAVAVAMAAALPGLGVAAAIGILVGINVLCWGIGCTHALLNQATDSGKTASEEVALPDTLSASACQDGEKSYSSIELSHSSSSQLSTQQVSSTSEEGEQNDTTLPPPPGKLNTLGEAHTSSLLNDNEKTTRDEDDTVTHNNTKGTVEY